MLVPAPLAVYLVALTIEDWSALAAATCVGGLLSYAIMTQLLLR